MTVAALVRRLGARQAVERTPPASGPALRRVLGVAGLTAVGLGTMLGGIFTTIGSGTLAAGPGVVASFLLSGLACVFVSLCYAELASMVPAAGSAYTYAYATLGEAVAWIIGWDLVLEYGVSVAPTAAAWSGYAQAYGAGFGLVLPAWARTAHLAHRGLALDPAHSSVDALAIAVVLGIAAMLAAGIRESATVNLWLVGVQLVAIVGFVALLGHAVSPARFAPAFPTGLHGVVSGAALVFFAYIGFDTVTVASEEARAPVRDVPRAVVLSLAIGLVLYVAIAVVTVGIVPWTRIDADAGMADAVRRAHAGPFADALVTVGAIAGTTTVMITSLLGQTRIFFVMARDRMLPRRMGSVNARTRTPVALTLATGVVVALLAGVVPIQALIAMVNVGTLSAFAIVCAGTLALRFAQPGLARPFRAPFGVATAALGCALCVYLMTGLEPATWIRFGVWFAIGAAVYAAYGFRRSLLRERPRA